MKKILLTAVTMIAALTASAGVEGTYVAEKFAGKEVDDATYTFAASEAWTSADEDAEAWQMNIALKDGNTYTLTNLMDWEESVEATYDEATGIFTIAAGTEVVSGYAICGSVMGHTEAEDLMNFVDAYSSYVATPIGDVQLKVEGDKVVALTPILSYYIYPYDSYVGYAYGIIYDLEFAKDGSGINTIAADNSNAPVEYYNLQGVRIANPANGQIVIMRQGNKASKVFIR